MTDEVGVLHTPLSIGSLWWAGGNVLFFATVSGPLLGGIPASLVLLNLQPRASIFYMCVGSSERLQRLTQGTAVSGLLWSVCFTLGVWAELLDLVDLELLQGLNGWRGRRGGGGCLYWWWVFGQPLTDLCIAEFSWPLRGGKIKNPIGNQFKKKNKNNTVDPQINPHRTRSAVMFEDGSSVERLQVDEVAWESAGEDPFSEDKVVTLCGLRHSDSSAFLGLQ